MPAQKFSAQKKPGFSKKPGFWHSETSERVLKGPFVYFVVTNGGLSDYRRLGHQYRRIDSWDWNTDGPLVAPIGEEN